METGKIVSWTTLIGYFIVLAFGVIIYSKIRGQTLAEVFADIMEMIKR